MLGFLVGLIAGGLVLLGVRAADQQRPVALPSVAAGAAPLRPTYRVGDWIVVLDCNSWARVEYVSTDGHRYGCRFRDGYAGVFTADQLAK